MAQEHKREFVNAGGCGFVSEEMKYLIFTFLGSGFEVKRRLEPFGFSCPKDSAEIPALCGIQCEGKEKTKKNILVIY